MKPTKAIIELISGHNVTVTPLTPLAQATMRLRAIESIPDIDPDPYRTEIPNALTPNAKTPAQDNPAYIEAVRGLERRRAHMVVGLTLDIAVSHDAKAALIAEHAGAIAGMRKLFEGTAIHDSLVSDWVVVLYSMIATGEEVNRLYEIASGNTALTDGEVQAGIAYFRQVALSQSDVS